MAENNVDGTDIGHSESAKNWCKDNAECSTSSSSNVLTQNECSDENENDWSEDEAENVTGVTDTMLTTTDYLNKNERQCIVNVAPAEGSKPVSVFWDKYAKQCTTSTKKAGNPVYASLEPLVTNVNKPAVLTISKMRSELGSKAVDQPY